MESCSKENPIHISSYSWYLRGIPTEADTICQVMCFCFTKKGHQSQRGHYGMPGAPRKIMVYFFGLEQKTW